MFSLLQMEGTMPFSVHPDMMVGEWLGGPFVYDGHEAWRFTDDAWKEFHCGILGSEGCPYSMKQFLDEFGDLPPLPKEAFQQLLSVFHVA
jgi:hypothetical protein